MVHNIRALAPLSLFILLFPVLGLAEVLKYEIKTYGEEVVITNITGPGAGSLSLTPSRDGKTLTISGIGASFYSSRSTPYPEIIKSVRTLAHGQLTDLVIELARGSKVRASPSTDALTISAKVDSPVPTKQDDTKSSEQKIAFLPPLPGGAGATRLGTVFRITSVLIDGTSALLNGTKLSYDTGVYEESNSCLDKEQRIKELELLVENLSQELLQTSSKK